MREYYKGIESSEHPSDDDKSSTTRQKIKQERRQARMSIMMEQ